MMESQQRDKDNDKAKNNNCHNSSSSTVGLEDPITKSIIRDAIISDHRHDGGNNHNHEASVARAPDDVLAYSRCVHKVDSSLPWSISVPNVYLSKVILQMFVEILALLYHVVRGLSHINLDPALLVLILLLLFSIIYPRLL